MKLNKTLALESLRRVSELIENTEMIQLTLIGGAAGMLTGQFASNRVTSDCDIISLIPIKHLKMIESVAEKVSVEKDLQKNWLNAKAMQLNVLPDGWDFRKVHIITFKNLEIYALGRKDLMATKFYAGSARDREDIQAMNPTDDELEFVKYYLSVLKVPSREANLDQIDRAFFYLSTFNQ